MIRSPEAACGWVKVALAKFQAAWGAALGGLFCFFAAVNKRHRASTARVVLVLENNIDLFKFSADHRAGMDNLQMDLQSLG